MGYALAYASVCRTCTSKGEGCMLPMRKWGRTGASSAAQLVVVDKRTADGACESSETEARAPDEVGKLGVRFIGWEPLPRTLIYE